MLRLADMYHPITGTPFQRDETYREYAPCAALRPYVRCFWGTERPVQLTAGQDEPGIVIPDTCMDIIFDLNYTRNTSGSIFATIDENSYRTGGWRSTDTTSTFAIRFYAWSAAAFTREDFTGRKNRCFPADMFFCGLRKQLEPLLWDVPDMQSRIHIAESLLMSMLEESRISADVMNGVYCVLERSGHTRIADLCSYTVVSQKRLERLFGRQLGLSPKGFSGLVRYQLLWQEVVARPGVNMLDLVEKYGYTDQAHLLHDFRRRHLMTPAEALQLAQRKR